ncbi:hypothetical protein [Paraburkholderia bannensis]|uniref:hypothetical protein n=1 Tax=Paraburkholderia bannensis TaxID=765414 RepID=UPI002AC36950|nr:hypothetical protein [Paraburkholderia bannensis]
MNKRANATEQMTTDDARAAGARFLGELSSSWRLVAYAWVDHHFPLAAHDEDDEQFTRRIDLLAEAYIDGIRASLLDALQPPKPALLAAEASIRAGQQTARELSAAHHKLTLEAERYGNDQ